MLVIVTRVGDFTRSISPALQGLRDKGDCEFCHEPVYYNRINYQEVKSKGETVTLCCTHCYQDGTYIKQGYRHDRQRTITRRPTGSH